jgi:hypothetical protein
VVPRARAHAGGLHDEVSDSFQLCRHEALHEPRQTGPVVYQGTGAYESKNVLLERHQDSYLDSCQQPGLVLMICYYQDCSGVPS